MAERGVRTSKDKRMVGVYLSADLGLAVKVVAALEERSVSTLVEEALRDYMNSHYGDLVNELSPLDKSMGPLETLAVLSALQVKHGTPPDETLLAKLATVVDQREVGLGK